MYLKDILDLSGYVLRGVFWGIMVGCLEVSVVVELWWMKCGVFVFWVYWLLCVWIELVGKSDEVFIIVIMK